MTSKESKTEKIAAELRELRIVPVVEIRDASKAVALADALKEGGLPCAEITFRTEAAAKSLQLLGKDPGLLLGAGTVLTIDQAKLAFDAGARFLVSPGFNPKVVEFALSHNMPIFPGVCNPTDIETALSFGLTAVKFFPAEAFGGVNTLKAISAPYGMMSFIPTGGIHRENIGDYLQLNQVIACGGSWMVKADLIDSGAFGEIAALTRAAVDGVRQLKR